MSELADWIWIASGGAAGMLQATLLWRAAQRRDALSPWAGMLRLGVVAATLIAAALCGRILPAAAGWALAFATCGGFYFTGIAGNRTDESPDAATPPPENLERPTSQRG